MGIRIVTVDWLPIWLSLKLSAITTLILFVFCIPLSWWITKANSHIRLVIQALVSMPLVLPPTVLGFYMLITFSPAFMAGRFFRDQLHIDLAFSFTGLVIGSVIFSLPFMMNPLISGIDSFPKRLTEAAYVLGKSEWEVLTRVLLPNLKPALLSGTALTFAHTMGEFGVVLMIGGKIPGKTKVASMAIYDEVEAMNYSSAHAHALILFAISFLVLLGLFLSNKRFSWGMTNQ
jgi:molybdate transport system permease protein